MPHKWDTGFVSSKDVVDARQYDNSFNNLAGAVNGGLDRENLPNSCISPTRIVAQSVAKCTIDRLNYEANTTAATGASYWNTAGYHERGNNLCGILYSDMQGGQTNIEAATSSVDTEEGMLSITWKCQQWINSHLVYYDAGGGPFTARYSMKGVYWQIKLDGNIVLSTTSYYQNWGNVLLECAVPVSKGTHEVKVEYNFANATERDYDVIYSNTPVFHWWGGCIFTTNRLR